VRGLYSPNGEFFARILFDEAKKDGDLVDLEPPRASVRQPKGLGSAQDIVLSETQLTAPQTSPRLPAR
jgi:hypothetical protein